MAGRYADALTLIQHQFPKFILLLDKFILVETHKLLDPTLNVEQMTHLRTKNPYYTRDQWLIQMEKQVTILIFL